MKRIILADDHAAIRLGLKTLIDKEPTLQIVGEASNGDDAIELIKNNECELVITDLSMPGKDGIHVLEYVKEYYPTTRVLILSMHEENDLLKKAVAKGVDGFILKSEPLESIIESVKQIIDGTKVFSESLKRMIIDDYSVILETQSAENSLTLREREILSRVAQGATNRQIATDLDISVRTVEAHRSRIMNKLNLKKVQDLVRFAISNGLI